MIKEANDYSNLYYSTFLENPQVVFLNNPCQNDRHLHFNCYLSCFLTFRIDHRKSLQ